MMKLFSAFTVKDNERITWFAVRSRQFFLFHQKHLFMADNKAAVWIECFTQTFRRASDPDNIYETTVLDELLAANEIQLLRSYLKQRSWTLQVKECGCHLFGKESSTSENMAGILFELFKERDYNLPFKAVGCVEQAEKAEIN